MKAYEKCIKISFDEIVDKIEDVWFVLIDKKNDAFVPTSIHRSFLHDHIRIKMVQINDHAGLKKVIFSESDFNRQGFGRYFIPDKKIRRMKKKKKVS